MASEPALAIAVSAREWPDRLRQALADHGGARVRLTALSAQELEEEHHDVLLIDDISSILTRGLIEREQGRGRRVIGVYDPEEQDGRHHLIDLGVDAVVGCDEPAETFVTTSQRIAISSERPIPSSVPVSTPTALAGVVVDVRGVSGGVGTSEIVLGLARALRPSTVIELGPQPSLAQRVGLDLHPNVASAIELIDHAGGDPAAAVQQADRGVGVLVGTSEPGVAGRGAARRLIDGLRGQTPWMLVDAGGCAPSVVADLTVYVTGATPVGVGRCVDALRGHDLVDTHLVLNRAPRGGFERAELFETVLGELRPRSITIIPDDQAVAIASWNGHAVMSGGFVKAVDSLAKAIVGGA
ncbi:MAG TPA: hypothetical protein VMS74_07850 [Acidimicrobiia bacterium]|nr:hypothetical protein [Acidimicrobiia bacterium]